MMYQHGPLGRETDDGLVVRLGTDGVECTKFEEAQQPVGAEKQFEYDMSSIWIRLHTF